MSFSMNQHMKYINLQNIPTIGYVNSHFANSSKSITSYVFEIPVEITEFESQNIHILLRW